MQWIIIYVCVLIRRKRGLLTLRSFGRGLAALDKKKVAKSAIVPTVVNFQKRRIFSFHYPGEISHGIPPLNQDRGAEEGIKSQS